MAGPAASRQSLSPGLSDHPGRNRTQDPLHHGQMLPVVMSLEERQIGPAQKGMA